MSILQPLDFKTITPFNVKCGRVPGMFAPRMPNQTASGGSPTKRGWGRGGLRGCGRGRGRGQGHGRGRGRDLETCSKS